MLAFCPHFWLTWEDNRGDLALKPVERGEQFDVVDLHPLGSILIVALELFWSKLLE
jgi:hypothetical protein